MKWKVSQNELIEVAKGERYADLYIKGGTVINVYSGEYLKQNVAVYQDGIAYVGENKASIGAHTKVIDAEGKYISPGFIETHAHPWVFYNPVSQTEKVLPLGTTTSANDNLFFYLDMGAKKFKEMLIDLRELPGNFLWLIRLISQSDFPGEREWFNQEDVRDLLQLEDVVGSAEVTRWPLLYQADPFLLDTIEFVSGLGKVVDGHNAGCSYEKLNAIAASGVIADHEAIKAEEAINRLRLGMWTVLRNSSLRPDLSEVIKIITEGQVDTRRVLMTTDGPQPSFIDKEGFVDGLVRTAVEQGVSAMTAIQMVTINAATYLRMDDRIGGVVPGKKADILILPDLVDFKPDMVISNGEIVAEDGQLKVSLPEIDWEKYKAGDSFQFPKSVLENPELYLMPQSEQGAEVPVIHFLSNVITKRKDMKLPAHNGHTDIQEEEGLVYAALIDRQGNWMTRGVMEGFAVHLDGMASTYNTTTELLVTGRKPEAMAKAAARVHELGGGVVIVDGDSIVLEIPLPLTGMMVTDSSFDTAVQSHDKLLSLMQERGFPFHDILYTLLFLVCDFLPGLRITANGLYDVKKDEIVVPSTSIPVYK